METRDDTYICSIFGEKILHSVFYELGELQDFPLLQVWVVRQFNRYYNHFVNYLSRKIQLDKSLPYLSFVPVYYHNENFGIIVLKKLVAYYNRFVSTKTLLFF